MALSAEKFLLMPIGYGAVPWDSATVTASHELTGGEGENVLTPRHDRGLYTPFTTPIDAQDETDYDNSPATEGTFAAGSGYADAEEITMSDGTVVTVDDTSSGPPGPVSEFTVDSSASTGAADGDTLTQASTTGSGTGFTLTLDEDNVNETKTLAFDLGATPPLINYIHLGGLQITGTGLAPEDVTILWESDTVSNFASPTAWGGTLSYVKRATGGAVARLDMEQPNLGLADAELPAIMNQGRLHSYVKSATFPAGVRERYHRLTITHTATMDADQKLYLPVVQGGWAWQPEAAWAPGQLRRRLVSRPAGDVLRGWDFSAQAVRDDTFHLKLLEWWASVGKMNRAIFWQDLDLDARFIQNCAMVQVLDMPASQRPGTYGQLTEETYSVGFNLIERFNDETET